METYLIENLTFTYPDRQQPSLVEINLAIQPGQFVVLLGPSGGGKSTLLRQLKTILTPHGVSSGRVLFQGRPLAEIEQREQAGRIGFVQQSPDNQIVTDKVWHELAFGLESLGLSSEDIRLRVAEMASFFGIQTWFHQDVSQLSGGQKQLLNLAAVMVMQPSVLILDEPTSQLDPIAATDFLDTLAKINRELGTTIILSEQRLEEVLPLADRALVLDAGRLIVDAAPREAAAELKRLEHDMFVAMPTPIRVWNALADPDEAENGKWKGESERNEPSTFNFQLSTVNCPLTVREGRDWLSCLAAQRPPNAAAIPPDAAPERRGQPVISIREASFSYQPGGAEVVSKLSLDVYPGQLYALVGGNGVGKTTALSLISGLIKPQRGRVLVQGRDLAQLHSSDLYDGLLGVLPQNPQALFVKKTVEADLYEMFKGRKMSPAEQERRVAAVVRLCELGELLNVHPYDLSGGEQQRAALAKVLLLAPQILLLDEPTKGLDGHFKLRLAAILKALRQMGVTIVLVSHDVEFCAAHADRCALMFDGAVVAEQGPRAFFAGQRFYTTAAHRMAGHILPQAVLAEDILLALGGGITSVKIDPPAGELRQIFAPAAAVNHSGGGADSSDTDDSSGGKGQPPFPAPLKQGFRPRRRLSRRTLAALVMILVAIPLTIYVGANFFGDRKYYFVSLLIILETLLPFILVFEDRKPQARELVVVAVLVALAVAGRAAFFMLPSFKPVLAIVIIAGVCFGGETGFLVGAMTGFVSNFFFGQGPWTPWQMFAFGLIGFLAGVLFQTGLLRQNRVSLCLFGGITALIVYGLIMDTANILIYQSQPSLAMLMTAYGLGLPFNMVHSLSTAVFLWFLARPLMEKLERIKVKYGLIE